jgi:hypothetical protein
MWLHHCCDYRSQHVVLKITAPHSLQCNKNIVVEVRIHYICSIPQCLAQWDANSKDSIDWPTIIRGCKWLTWAWVRLTFGIDKYVDEKC